MSIAITSPAQDDKKKPQQVEVVNKPSEPVPVSVVKMPDKEIQVDVKNASIDVNVTNRDAGKPVFVTMAKVTWEYQVVEEIERAAEVKAMIGKWSSDGWELVPMQVPAAQANYTGFVWRRPR